MFTKSKDAMCVAGMLAKVAGTKLDHPDVYECEPDLWYVVDENNDSCICYIVRVVFVWHAPQARNVFAVLVTDGHDRELHRVVDLETMLEAVGALTQART